MPRKFRYVGLINAETRVLFTNADRMKKIIDDGFSQQFEQQKEFRDREEAGIEENLPVQCRTR
ncbi:hypothetical protein [Massilia phyllosphaerae]|uniref:hypothetical protein n=1 Tax=Massilia phyllosphaerae TaxID=3106034 RepID=UPI002B1CD4E7|nr:hypothetical protein [Massilia sp. SGZ-792]